MSNFEHGASDDSDAPIGNMFQRLRRSLRNKTSSHTTASQSGRANRGSTSGTQADPIQIPEQTAEPSERRFPKRYKVRVRLPQRMNPPPPPSPHAEEPNEETESEEEEENNEVVVSVEHRIQMKQILTLKILKFSWLENENLVFVRNSLHAQGLQQFVELEGNFYIDLVKLFYANMKVENNALVSQIRGREVRIDNTLWRRVAGLRNDGIKISKGNTGAVPNFNKEAMYKDCLRHCDEAMILKYNVGRMKRDERLLAFFLAWQLIPRGSNHAQLMEEDLTLIHWLKNRIKVNWIYVIKGHMFKAKRLNDHKLPYAILISKFLDYFSFPTEGETTKIVNHKHMFDNYYLRKMGLTKTNGEWSYEAGASSSGHGATFTAGTSSGTQQDYTAYQMVPYSAPPTYQGVPMSEFERMLISRLNVLTSMQHNTHETMVARFTNIDYEIDLIQRQLAELQVTLESYGSNAHNTAVMEEDGDDDEDEDDEEDDE